MTSHLLHIFLPKLKHPELSSLTIYVCYTTYMHSAQGLGEVHVPSSGAGCQAMCNMSFVPFCAWVLPVVEDYSFDGGLILLDQERL